MYLSPSLYTHRCSSGGAAAASVPPLPSSVALSLARACASIYQSWWRWKSYLSSHSWFADLSNRALFAAVMPPLTHCHFPPFLYTADEVEISALPSYYVFKGGKEIDVVRGSGAVTDNANAASAGVPSEPGSGTSKFEKMLIKNTTTANAFQDMFNADF